MNEDIFTVKARRCKRCGGLLTSKKAVEEGYGHTCKVKIEGEVAAQGPIDGQMSLAPYQQEFEEE